MAQKNDKYRNPEPPPGWKAPLTYPVLLDIDQNPDAPPGLYKFETTPDNTKLYVPYFDFILDLKLLLEDPNLTKDDSDFVPNTSDEDEGQDDEDDDGWITEDMEEDDKEAGQDEVWIDKDMEEDDKGTNAAAIMKLDVKNEEAGGQDDKEWDGDDEGDDEDDDEDDDTGADAAIKPVLKPKVRKNELLIFP